jgi:hypothetical protein
MKKEGWRILFLIFSPEVSLQKKTSNQVEEISFLIF